MANDSEGYHTIDETPKKSLTRTVLTSLTFWIIVGTLGGILLGEFAPSFSKESAPLKNIFLRPIQFVVFPLVFSSLVYGIAGNKQLNQLGRLSLKSFVYFEVVTTLALIIGLFAVNIAKPGSGVGGSAKKSPYKTANSTLNFEHWIDHLTPKTWGEMMGGGGSTELLQVLAASILVGVSTAQLHNESREVIVHFAKAVMDMMFNLVDIVIWTAPIGVCFAVANSVAINGMSALGSLGALVLTLYITLIVFVIIILVPIMLALKISPIEFVSAMREPLLIAFTTATSEAALPKVFESLDRYGVSPHISAFVVPFGYSFNLDGSTLYLSLAAVFCAQAAGVHKSIGEQIVMVLMLMISSKGVAGVRSATIIVLAATVEQFNIPSWPVTLILSADWFMDMGRTITNVFGNCLAAIVMAKMENEFRVEGWKTLVAKHDATQDELVEKASVTHV